MTANDSQVTLPRTREGETWLADLPDASNASRGFLNRLHL
jgi:hypothetical protein